MVRDQIRVVACELIQRPIRRHHVRIVVGPANAPCLALVPTGPRTPVQIGVILESGNLIGGVVEETLPDAVLEIAAAVLQPAPEHVVDEVLVLIDLLFVGLAIQLHAGCQPGSCPAFIAQPGNPHAAVLLDNPIRFAIVTHH